MQAANPLDPLPLTEPLPAGRPPLYSVVRAGHARHTPAHTHHEGQLLYPEQGSTMLEIQGRVIRLAPDRAAWIPSGVPHSVLIDRSYRYHSLYVDPSLYAAEACMVLFVRPLWRELIRDVGAWDEQGLSAGQRECRAQVIVDELARAPRREPGIPMPDDRCLAMICRALEQDPADDRSLQAWARYAGASARTVQRAFAAHTGLSFQQWRNLLRMTRAAELHMQGMRQLDIALAVGYATEGAYAQAFKKFYGYPPSRLRAAGGRDRGARGSA